MSLIIKCSRSGLPLAKVESLTNGSWPLIESFDGKLLHPIYNLPFNRLLKKFDNLLNEAHSADWLLTDNALTDIKLSMSATMYALDAIWSPASSIAPITQSLPSDAVAVGSADRLYDIAEWFHLSITKQVAFPLYRISKDAGNLQWDNFATWLDDVEEIWDSIENGKKKLAAEAEEERKEALHTVRAADIYKKLDLKKVWNWMDIQLAESELYPAGRRETFKTLFFKADMSPEDWTTDDVDDLVEAVMLCCDGGNEISHFIHTRLSNIRAAIVDFFSGFTILSTAAAGVDADILAGATAQETALLQSFEDAAKQLDSLPAEPQRKDYPTMGAFMKAQAQWRIIARRYKK